MKQQTLAMVSGNSAGFEPYRRPTQRDAFLATMAQIAPWQKLYSVIEPHYPKAGNGPPPIGLERRGPLYFVQHGFNLVDEACEEALLDSTALRRFVGIDPGRERVPDGPPLLKRWQCAMTSAGQHGADLAPGPRAASHEAHEAPLNCHDPPLYFRY
jgi:transposase, IS5 family